jgi:hypothetical protein
MAEDKPVEEKINEFYRVAWAIVEDLILIDTPDNDPIRTQTDTFVSAIKRSLDKLTTEGYDAAREAIDEASASIIRLCRYKDLHLPNVDSGLSRECKQAYRALFKPGDVTKLDTSLLNRSFVDRMEQAYAGQSHYLGPSKPLGNLDTL